MTDKPMTPEEAYCKALDRAMEIAEKHSEHDSVLDPSCIQTDTANAIYNDIFDLKEEILNKPMTPTGEATMTAEEQEMRRALTALLLEVDHRIVDDVCSKVEVAIQAQRADAAREEREKLTKWQPIDTAPKDGTAIDLFVKTSGGRGWRVPECWYRPDINEWMGHDDPPFVVSQRYKQCNPTHWMPLPEPPKEGAPKE